MREPWFWRSRSLTARAIAGALSPAAALYQAGQKLRWRMTKPQRAPIPVICIGNASLGGVGKTPFAMLVERLLREKGVRSFFLTRGFGGALKGPLLVDPEKHNAHDVGDEALLLARRAPTILAANRPAGAALAAEKGAGAVIMDDGFQNPTLRKDLSILLVAADAGDAGERLFPAGPFREPLREARARADVVVAIGANETAARGAKADFHAWLAPAGEVKSRRVIAFAGLGRPERFFAMLETYGFELAGKLAFPDHHPFRESELDMLARKAKKENAQLITTEKDFVRLTPAFQAQAAAFPVEMRIDNPEELTRRLMARIAVRSGSGDDNADG